MLLPEIKEREYRFRLALRLSLPIFALLIALITSTFSTSYESLNPSFYTISILLIVFSVYFVLYIIYNSFDIKITEPVTKTFTREYLFKHLNKELSKKKQYTLFLISISNLNEINSRYGMDNGDKVLKKVVDWSIEYFKEKNLKDFYIGQLKGGDFVIGIKGLKSKYATILELMCLKASDFKVDEIEVKLSSAITDTEFSYELEFLIENLFHIEERNRNQKNKVHISQEIDPSELELYVINAVKQKSFSVTSQDIFESEKAIIKECFVKLKVENSKIIYPKTYIKILDKLGIMSEFDLMVLEKNIYNCNQNSEDIYAMNISPSSLRNQNFLQKAKELIRENSNVYGRLIFMLNEHQYYSHIDRYNATIKSLREIGILIAIDRLGAIHTSFLYLKELDVDMVRFDSSITKDIKSKNTQAVVKGFNIMAQSRDIKTWMKMIESKDIKDLAQDLNIDYLQGKHLSPIEIRYNN